MGCCGCTDVDSGGGGGGGGMDLTAFRYVATGAEAGGGSDFFIALPVALPNDSYFVTASCAGVAAIFTMDFPDLAAGDRTNLQFRIVTSAAVQAGDQIDIFIASS